ncbi:MAG: amidohydrolase family protein [Gammaproteobacteria bacterium]
MANDLVLRNVRPMAQSATDVLIRDGRIAELGPAVATDGIEYVEGNGAVLIPGLVEAHTHLDKTLLGTPWYRNEVGPRLIDKIENERQVKQQLGLDPQIQSERQALLSVANGSTHIRSHVDVDAGADGVGLTAIEGVAVTRDKLAGLVEIEIVAFPQSGLLTRPGTLELMAEALQCGAGVVGGIDPASMDRDPRGHVDAVFDLAERYGRPLDIHLHEAGELGAFSMELILERTLALGMQGKVTISHAFCLGMGDKSYVAHLIERLAHAQVHIMTTGPAARPAPPLETLLEAGVVVCSGSDGIRDTWGPYGNADMLERAMFVGLANNFRRDDEVELALDVCTYGGAKVMALEDYGLSAGCRADLVLVQGETLADVVVSRAPRQLVVKRGQVVAREGVCLTRAP